MHAWRAHEHGTPDTLRWDEVPDPPLAEGQMRIAIRASAVNFPDALLVAGTYQVKPPLPVVPGMEIAGVVVESRAPAFPVGARVASTLDGTGGYATHAVTSSAYRIPDTMSFEDAAAITVTYQTGWFALHRRARIQPGEVLLVHAGAGGVGSAAIQLGKAAGARVIATAGGARKVELCRQLGADVAVDYTSADFVETVKAETRGRGADVIYDPVGGEVFERSTKCIAFEGRLVVIGFTSGTFPTVRANHLLVKNYSVVGLHWGLYRHHDPAAVDACQDELYRMHGAGQVRPLLSERLPLAEAPAALARVAGRGSVGKIVLVALAALALAAGCRDDLAADAPPGPDAAAAPDGAPGPDAGALDGPAARNLVSGTIGGAPFDAMDAIDRVGAAGVQFNGPSTAVALTDWPDACLKEMSAQGVPGGRRISLALAVVDALGDASPASLTGDYIVFGSPTPAPPLAAQAAEEVTDPSCLTTLRSLATTGKVTVTKAGDPLQATFDLTFESGDHVTGALTAATCPFLDPTRVGGCL
jgi:NADPH2:quinone reductase